MAKQKQKKDEPTPLPHETLGEASIRWLAESLRRSAEGNPEEKELERLRELCRKGNPFPLIAKQWPELVIEDSQEIEIFQSHMREERFALCTTSIKDACFDSGNPHLRLDWWQKIILAGFFAIDIGEIACKGCTGCGKGASTSMGYSLWFDVYGKSRITLTGRDREHALKNIFGETKDWFTRMQFKRNCRILGESIEDSERHYIKTLNPDPSSPTAGEAFSGAHGENTLYGFDERSSLPDTFTENARKNAQKIISTTNPRMRSGEVYREFEAMGADNIDKIGCCTGKLGKRLCVTIGGPDCINVAENRLKIPVAPAGGFSVNGRTYGDNEVLSPEDAPAVKPLIPRQMDVLQFRITQNDILPECFAFGRFPKEDAQKQIILPSWLKRHEEAHNDSIRVTCVGADIGASLDGDPSAFAFGGEDGCRKIHPVRIPDSIQTAEELLRISRDIYGLDLTSGHIPVCIDYGGGYGRGVGDYLKTKNVWVIEFQPGGASDYPRNYANMRAEGYGTLGLRLDPSGPFGIKPWALPIMQGLREELCAPERVFSTDGIKFKVHPKDEIKKALGRSPDLADSLTYLFHAVRKRHELDQWLFKVQNRELLCYPSKQSEVVEIKRVIDDTPKPKTEWDDVPWDWAEPKKEGEERKIVVSQPDKNPRRPWYERFLKD